MRLDLSKNNTYTLMNNQNDLRMATPTPTLTQHIKRRDWDRARLRMMTHPPDAHYRSKEMFSPTPLHLACLYQAPPDLIELLIDANPDALLLQDHDGLTPLHLAMSRRGDQDRILLLIHRGGKPPTLLQSHRIGTPLHLACSYKLPLATLEALVQVNRDLATVPNKAGFLPAEVVWIYFLRTNNRLWNAVIVPKRNGNENSVDHSVIIKDLIDGIKILLKAAMATHDHYETLNLHDFVSNFYILGELSPFLDFLLCLYPEQAATLDRKGNYPLHLAARNPDTVCDTLCRVPRMWTPRDPIERLVSSYPFAARVPDLNGGLPLHLALKTGQRKWGEGLSSLVKAYPIALKQRDHETGLFPFQLAATFLEGDDSECLGTIFELLLACPYTCFATSLKDLMV